MKFLKIAIALAATSLSSAAFADPVVDGAYDAEYGAADANVLYNPLAPTSNFGAPTNGNASSAYSIFLTGGTDSLYGFFQADRPTSLQFANLYFDLDVPNGNGSDLGFEIGRNGVNAFVPGRSGSVTLSGISTAFSSDGLALEFALPYTLFSAPIAGLNYYADQQFAGGGSVRLNLSQAFGYSVAGGSAFYGANRLGTVAVPAAATGAVPEPATWAMMLMGFGAVGFAMRSAKRRSGTGFDLKIKRLAAGI